MPDATSAVGDQRVLENGLTVRVYHAPRLKRSAAFLRVHVGSHDVPPAWPGMAHFLEHLLFLGTERFAGDQALMPYVQRQGGQLNASTAERHTDYFFEVPPQALSSGLERLCDMLANARLSLADQRREREVLHAEFVAWSRSAEARHQFWMVGPLSARHPLRGFHAGNRYSLPVPQAAFQQALHAFHREHYQAGQMTLCLVGPQSSEQMLAVAQRAAQCLASGQRLPLAQPPALMAPGEPALESLARSARAWTVPPAQTRLNLVFACQGLPPGSDEALAFLATWFSSGQPGGLQAELKRRELINGLSLAPFYQFQDQALINIEFNLTEAGQQATALIAELCFDWLEFFEAHDDWHGLREEYRLLDKRQRQLGGALEIARRYSTRSNADAIGFSEAGLQALRAVLGHLKAGAQLHALRGMPAKGRSAPAGGWRLPQRNRFLRASRQPDLTVPAPRSMLYLAGATPGGQQGVLTLRWHLPGAHESGLARVVEHSLQRLLGEARQAGVVLAFSSLGDIWQLRLSGVIEPLPAILAQALECLTAPAPEAWRRSREEEAPPDMAIRQLLKALPEHCVGRYQTLARFAREDLKPLKLHKLWASARWDGMGLEIDGPLRSALNAVLLHMPGTPDRTLSQLPSALTARIWRQVPTRSSEAALLLFCPTPTQTVTADAHWRLIAHLAQTPFYQRLRVELQLGYAVFSGYRQIAGRAGLVFGVQSPGSPCAGLLDHIERFLAALPKLIASHGTQGLHDQCQVLSARLSREEMDPDALAETLWQAHLGGYPGSYLRQLQDALQAVRPEALLEAVGQLRDAAGGWLCLANAPAPGPAWEALETRGRGPQGVAALAPRAD
jgi:coenzyme PQQ biosynthesis probable peptidase PqqF